MALKHLETLQNKPIDASQITTLQNKILDAQRNAVKIVSKMRKIQNDATSHFKLLVDNSLISFQAYAELHIVEQKMLESGEEMKQEKLLLDRGYFSL